MSAIEVDAAMEEITTVGLELAKNVFRSTEVTVMTRAIVAILRQTACLHGGDGSVFQQSSLVPRDWGSGVYSSIDPASLCEAISEAAIRPTTRFVPVKSAERQSRAMRARQCPDAAHKYIDVDSTVREHRRFILAINQDCIT
ncbi:hypothetical protein HED63_23400 [Ochrobactrum cytisi]|nr:hypothetical protein [Brucella cytisi]